MQSDNSGVQPHPASSTLGFAVCVFVLALLAQLPLILNPGYFSHDELQWAAMATPLTGQPVPWFSWVAIDTYQYRPLTFNLWLLLSRACFDQPMLFHAVCVVWGSLNALLLAWLGRAFGMGARSAALGALAFALGPYAVFVHGWVGTMADLIWLTSALVAGLLIVRASSSWRAFAIAALCTTVGLAGKEAAITIPPLLAVAWLFDGRKPRWFAATAGAGLVVAFYLGLRYQAMLESPQVGPQYALSLWHPPLRWLEYQLFTPIPTVFETFTTLDRGFDKRALVAALLWLALCVALWRAGPRWLALFLVGGVAALFAVLPLGSSWNHYGYGFAALTAMVVASAWAHTTRGGRVAIGLMAALTLMHGAFVMSTMYRVGAIQATFSPALAQVASRAGNRTPVRLRPAVESKQWIFLRLTHEVPSYLGTPIGDRMQLVDAGAPADYIIEMDGRLTPAR